MIRKVDILARAAEWGLRPDVVEKDYVLGWLLAGVATHASTRDHWVFKGGTCLKKCIIETYRFSEDLDFTLLPDAAYSEAAIAETLREIAALVAEWSGIRFPAPEVTVHPRVDRLGRETFEGRIGYIGPMAVPGPPKIRFDLTMHESLIQPPRRRTVLHPYPDELPPDATVNTYSFPELLAEKLRALCERARPRDLYDVIRLADLELSAAERSKLREVIKAKFGAKGLVVPTTAAVIELVVSSEEMRSEWDNMLAHQLPELPALDDQLARLPRAIDWLEEHVPGPAQQRLAPIGGGANETLVVERGMRMWGVGVPIEAIRFAGSSRLLVEFTYHGHRRVVEPYSLRTPRTGNLLLYGFEREKNGARTDDIRAYQVGEISGVRILQRGFTPRYAVEFTAPDAGWRQ